MKKKREKSKRNFVHHFFIRSTIIAIFQKRYGTSPCALHAVTAVPPFGTRPSDMHMDARRRRDGDCTGKICAFGGAFARSKMATLFSRFSPGIFSPFFTPTRAILREFWTFRRPRERGPSLHNPSLSFFPFPFFFLLFLPPPPPFSSFPRVVKKCRISSGRYYCCTNLPQPDKKNKSFQHIVSF